MYEEILTKGNAYDLGNIKEKKISGTRKVAVLLMTLGTDISSNIIKDLSDKHIQKIGVEIANLSSVSAKERREILKEFLEMRKERDFALEGGIDYAKDLLNGALDSKRAKKLMDGIKYDTHAKVFISARKAEAKEILACIQGESPQTIAIILSHIQPEKSAEIICNLNQELQRQVALKLGTIQDVSPVVIKAIDNALERKLSSIGQDKIDSSSGFDYLVDILGKVDGKTEKNILGFLEDKDNILAEKIKSNMFVFENIVSLDDTSVQRVLKEVNLKDVAIALKDVSEDISEVILRNQSSRAATALKEEISLLGIVKVSQIEESKRNIVKVIRRLENEGLITIIREGEDEVVV